MWSDPFLTKRTLMGIVKTRQLSSYNGAGDDEDVKELNLWLALNPTESLLTAHTHIATPLQWRTLTMIHSHFAELYFPDRNR